MFFVYKTWLVLLFYLPYNIVFYYILDIPINTLASINLYH